MRRYGPEAPSFFARPSRPSYWAAPETPRIFGPTAEKPTVRAETPDTSKGPAGDAPLRANKLHGVDVRVISTAIYVAASAQIRSQR